MDREDDPGGKFPCQVQGEHSGDQNERKHQTAAHGRS